MSTQANKISDNGNIEIYSDKNIRKLLTFDCNTTTISIDGNEIQSRPPWAKKWPIRHKVAQWEVQHFYFRTSNYTT